MSRAFSIMAIQRANRIPQMVEIWRICVSARNSSAYKYGQYRSEHNVSTWRRVQALPTLAESPHVAGSIFHRSREDHMNGLA